MRKLWHSSLKLHEGKRIMNKQKKFTSALISVLIISGLAYLILGTGLHGDDYIEIVKMSNFTYAEFFYPSPYIHNHYVLGLPAHYFLFWAYKFLGYEYLFAYDLIKVLSHGMCIWFIFKFCFYYCPNHFLHPTLSNLVILEFWYC